MNRNAKESIYEVGQTLGLTKDEVISAIKMRKRQIFYIVIPVMALSAFSLAVFRVLGTHYGGVSIQDFRVLGTQYGSVCIEDFKIFLSNSRIFKILLGLLGL